MSNALFLTSAALLGRHLHVLADRQASKARDTVVVAGGGFTGIEVATELPARLRAILGKNSKPRVIIVDGNTAIAPDMGSGPHTEFMQRVVGRVREAEAFVPEPATQEPNGIGCA